jgi:hypothetical protein
MRDEMVWFPYFMHYVFLFFCFGFCPTSNLLLLNKMDSHVLFHSFVTALHVMTSYVTIAASFSSFFVITALPSLFLAFNSVHFLERDFSQQQSNPLSPTLPLPSIIPLDPS